MKLLRLTNCLALVAALAFTSMAQAQQVELGGNLGFEDALVPNALGFDNFGTFDNGGNTSAGNGTINPLTGLGHASIAILGDANSFAGIQQDVTAIEGESYTFSFSATTDGNPFDIGNEYRLEFIGPGNTEISRSQLTDTFDNGGTYAPFSVSGVAPAGAEFVRAVIALQSFQGGTTGTAFIDDASITGPAAAAVPEPGSLTLVALGALGLVARRRRS